MKENTLSIEIKKSPEEVFQFTTNPKNTSTWIKDIEKEEVSEHPIKVGTVYKNVNQKGTSTKYKVINWEENKVFELKEIDGSYSVRYMYTPLKNGGVRLTYFERDERGLKNPFKQEVLEKLKTILEDGF